MLELTPNSHSPLAIACRHLETAYQLSLKRPILANVSCQIQTGEFVALVGLNGAGKSTLLRALVGLVPLTRGSIQINGLELTAQTQKQIRRNVGLLFQGGGLIRQLSALENVLCGRLGNHSPWKTLWGFTRRDRLLAMELLSQLGLADLAEQKTGHLSGGQQQRVAIARALIQSPQILLADEPIAGLDVLATRQVMDILAELHREQKMTIVTVLHDLSMAETYADRAIVLEAGQIIHDGSCHHLQSRFAHLQSRDRLAS